jgi:hypothetical protein
MPFKVGGIIASRTNKAVGTPATALMSNVNAFEAEVTNGFSANWTPFYGWVKPWDDATIQTYVDQICAEYDPDPTAADAVKVIVVTGTTLGEKVKHYRDNHADETKRDVWIVMATDDGDWTAIFSPPGDPNLYERERVTGTTSGYSRPKAGSGKTITWHRTKDVRKLFKDEFPGDTIHPAVLLADNTLLSPHAQNEKARQIADVQDALGVAALTGQCRVTKTDNLDGSTTFGFTESADFRKANLLIVLADAVTFLARQEIADAIANVWNSFWMSSGPHCAYQLAGLTTSYGPSMDSNMNGRYHDAASWVIDILQGNPPKKPKTALSPGDLQECP